MSTINHKEFYNRIAQKYGLFDDFSKFIDHSNFPNGDPEAEYLSIIKKISSTRYDAIDIGCGDGTFTKKIVPLFKSIIGVDISDKLIKYARNICQETNAKFENIDFKQPTMKDKTFEIALNRRGPSTYAQIYNVLKPNGHYVELAVGNSDAIVLKDYYYVDSKYDKWPIDTEKWKNESLINSHISPIFSRTYLYTDHFENLETFIKYLHHVPILDDFSDSHIPKIKRYAIDHSKDGYIFLDRHRVIIHGIKV